MSLSLESLGEHIAKQDNDVYNLLKNSAKQEQKVVDEYELLNKFKQVTDLKKLTIEQVNELNTQLELRKQYLEKKNTYTEEKITTMNKLLEYIKELKGKDRLKDINKISNEIKKLEKIRK